MSNDLGKDRRRERTLRQASIAMAVASTLLAGCSTAESVDGTAPVDPPSVASSTETASVQNPDDSEEATGNASADMCELVGPDDIATVVEAAAVPTPETGDLLVGDPTPLVAGECSFAVERVGTGAGHVQLRAGDDSTFGHYRDVEDVTARSGLGDEAYRFHGVAGPELHVRQGDAWLGVRFGSYDDRLGLTDDSHDQIATVVLDRLTGG